MKLFFVIYVLGQIRGTVGPLPYDMAECQHRVIEKHAELDPNVVTPDGITSKDIEFKCEYHAQRPHNVR